MVWSLSITDDVLSLFWARWGREGSCWLFFNVQFGYVVPSEDGKPAFFVFGSNGCIDKAIWFFSKGKLAGKYSCSQLPSVQAIIYSYDKVGVIDEGKWILYELSIFDFVGIENALKLFFACLLLFG